ncbi:plasmalemma vesicle-associated protein [Pyxicephalus adspersus]|uniref:Uncharacterized protein n=1 Tax=Pyxicephalus adspersus TaxID=30357 RepID=A0AAV3AZN1_PYXAD|nr:TPA: hypothetical protein GDO54_008669 [Pyxicephalus adspersus]
MDSSYAMAKFGLESKEMFKSKQKGCWHYMKYFFFFSSIIQFLIILGLVLFMLYGNAHAGTEDRLKSVENRYKTLTVDYALLKSNYTLLIRKLGTAEKEIKNCTDTVSRMRVFLNLNRTTTCPRFPPISTCNHIQAALDHLNMTCYNARLKAENERMKLEIEFNQYKDNCTKTITAYSLKDHMFTSENVQLQKDKKDLGSQIKLLQDSCTSIDEKFRLEIQNFRNIIESTLKVETPDYLRYNCKPISDTINNRIDFTLNKLRQDVNNIAFENTQLRVVKERINEDLGSCNKDKNIITAEKNNLAAEKMSLQKQLGEVKETLSTSYTRFMKKEEELENCKRLQMRPPVFPPMRS